MSGSLELVLLFAAPRTGSTNLMKELNVHEGVEALDEVFHPAMTHSITPNCKKFIAKSVSCKERNYAHKFPVKTLDALVKYYEKNGIKKLVLSIFPGHLGSRVVFDLFQRYSITVLFMQRRPVDMYISQMKANKTKKYSSVDTTKLQVEITQERYIKWYLGMHAWYSFNFQLLKKLDPPILYIHYEKFYSVNKRVQQFNYISDFLSVDRIDPKKLSPMKRQDSSLNWFSKVDDSSKMLNLDFSVGYDFYSNYFVE